jgi:hypothetical protein
MRRLLLTLLLFALIPSVAPARVRPPVVVELFTAQGCSSCIKANELVSELSERPDVLALTFAVDYWDYMGWPDTFAQPAFTALPWPQRVPLRWPAARSALRRR